MAKAIETETENAVAGQSAEGTVVTNGDLVMQSFIQWCVEHASGTDEDTNAMMQEILVDILLKDNIADALRESAPLGADELVGVPLILHNFQIREGDHAESLIGFYAALTVSRAGFEGTRVVTCGGMKVLARLKKIDEFDAFPCPVMFTSKKTKKGNTILDMVTPEM